MEDQTVSSPHKAGRVLYVIVGVFGGFSSMSFRWYSTNIVARHL